jgi:hypothetical protein
LHAILNREGAAAQAIMREKHTETELDLHDRQDKEHAPDCRAAKMEFRVAAPLASAIGENESRARRIVRLERA